jgi:hypothetical protein
MVFCDYNGWWAPLTHLFYSNTSRSAPTDWISPLSSNINMIRVSGSCSCDGVD